MNADSRLDQQIRAALEWQAEQGARRAPSLSQSARQVAHRLSPKRTGLSPVVVARPASGRSLQLIFIVLLLLAMIAAALAIGSELIRVPVQIQPGPFGLSRTCVTPMKQDVLLEVQRGAMPVTLYSDGTLVLDESDAGDSFTATIERTVVTQRRLSSRGIDLLLERLAEAGLTPGCRTLRTQEQAGSITARTDGEHVQLRWGSGVGQSSLTRQAKAQEEASADALAESLQHPETWLPNDAWVDPVARRIIPDRWLLTVSLIDTEIPPGSTLTLGSGRTLEGTDPRYGLVELPNGVRPADFGVGFPSPFSPAPRSSVRCGAVSRDEALTAAKSIDALKIDEGGGDSLHNDDVTAEVSFGFEPILQEAFDCEAAMAFHLDSAVAPGPSPPAPDGDLGQVDPCAFVSDTAMDILGVTTRHVAPSRLALGTAANACFVSKPPDVEPIVAGANLSLYPRSVDRDNARRLAESLLGDGFVEEAVEGDLLWSNTCPGGPTPCGQAIAVWSEPHFVAIEFESLLFPTSANATAEVARSFAGAVLEGVPE